VMTLKKSDNKRKWLFTCENFSMSNDYL
jgi:hypothetical protein